MRHFVINIFLLYVNELAVANVVGQQGGWWGGRVGESASSINHRLSPEPKGEGTCNFIYSQHPLSRLPAISNFHYLELISPVPSAFTVTSLEKTSAISNSAISNFHYLEPFFRSLQPDLFAISNFFDTGNLNS